MGYQDYVNTIKENGQEFDAETAREVVGFNSLIYASESLPVLNTLSRFTKNNKAPVGALLKRLDETTNNSFSRAVQKVAKSNAGRVITRGVEGYRDEYGQELLQNMLSNMVADKIVKYDPGRGFITEDSEKEAEIGGVLGFLVNSMFAALPG